jgi:hypothetical protein
MKAILFILSALTLAVPPLALPAPPLPATATPVASDTRIAEEPMVVLPALKFLGASRLSTIQHCAEIVKVTDWAILSTDSELEGMQSCLEEHT